MRENSRLAQAVKPHLESFNSIFGGAKLLKAAIKDIGIKTFPEPKTVQTTGAEYDAQDPDQTSHIQLRITSVALEPPQLPPTNKFSTRNRLIYPSECRERHATYRGQIRARLEVRIDNGEWHGMVHDVGQIPIMVRRSRCHLENLSPEELVERKVEAEVVGGYFIVNGNERLIRLLIVAKRNYPMAIVRESFIKRGPSFSKFGIQIRCVRPDETSEANFLHYLEDGGVVFRFKWKRGEYLVPVVMIMKALVDTNDRAIFEAIGTENVFIAERIELLFRDHNARYKLHGVTAHRKYLGERFKSELGLDHCTDEEVGIFILRKVVLVHLGNVDVTPSQNRQKFDLLIFMMRKLYALSAGDCASDNPDAVSSQEILLGGFVYGMIIKEKLEIWMNSIEDSFRALIKTAPAKLRRFCHPRFVPDTLPHLYARMSKGIGGALEYFLSTGNVSNSSLSGLPQASGFTIVAEKINFYRFISHFRMVHRGSYFAELKTTAVRKLLPESWGFLCPVHTPDGSPCGLLNHLAHECRVTTKTADVSSLPPLLSRLGVNDKPSASTNKSVVVQLNGRVLGYCTPRQARLIADSLRYFKVEGSNGVPLDLEVGHIPNTKGGLYPGIFLASGPARMVRPVQYLPLDMIDLIGPFEQPFMPIACVENEIKSGESTHVETDVRNILSILANQTPFSDHNQSPRNMYQCQMAKQAMGTAGTSLRYRTDNKAYQLQTGQTPVARSPLYEEYNLTNYPNGMNAVVAVVSYTGYDMDDAMIINKSAHERGFAYGTVFKTKVVHIDDTNKRARAKGSAKMLFGFAPHSLVPDSVRKHLDNDGLPYIGTLIQPNDVLCVSHPVNYDQASGTYRSVPGKTSYHRYREAEPAFVEAVRLLGAETGDMPCQAVSIKLRVPRPPVIGDKFSSRHGQKGVCSQKWPARDMPFSETGLMPDIIINPHAFPSRMTIGMFLESLAGKAGALHGLNQDASPWRFHVDDGEDDLHPSTAASFFGEQLRAAGFNFHGTEPMYSGIDGRELAADVFIGVVFYQRLRHMVADKFQVRTTGPVAPRTGQPVKGRARGGGIRVGEMERDALLAHGTVFLLQDRLLNCSDYARAWICRSCGSFLSVQAAVVPGLRKGVRSAAMRCRRCAKPAPAGANKADVWTDGLGATWAGGEDVTIVAIPAVLKYLDVECSAMGVNLKFSVEP